MRVLATTFPTERVNPIATHTLYAFVQVLPDPDLATSQLWPRHTKAWLEVVAHENREGKSVAPECRKNDQPAPLAFDLAYADFISHAALSTSYHGKTPSPVQAYRRCLQAWALTPLPCSRSKTVPGCTRLWSGLGDGERGRVAG